MLINPTHRFPSNLTIALIRRNRHNPEWAARRELNRLPSVRVAVAQRGFHLPPAVLLPSLSHARYAGAAELAERLARLEPAEWPYARPPHHRPDGIKPDQPYNPHRIPNAKNPFGWRKSIDADADAKGGNLDVTA